jgi:hypothetical protein
VFNRKKAADMAADLVLANEIAGDFNVAGVPEGVMQALGAYMAREDEAGFARLHLEIWTALCAGLVGVAAHNIDEAQEILRLEIERDRGAAQPV